MNFEEITKEEIAANTKSDYDDKYILKRLMQGISREEIALELNHKSYRTLDMYMRRRGYTWNSEKNIYETRVEENNNNNKFEELSSTFKVKKIISYLDQGMDPKEVTKKVGLKDHRSMAEYMKSKGYAWSPRHENYILVKGKVDDYDDDIEQPFMEDNIDNEEYNNDDKTKIRKLIPMLDMIYKNQDKLIELLAINNSSKIPRYVVGGVTITKSLSMSYLLSELVKEFSRDKNISQREIFEVAIIEFLKKYGYENEVRSLFA